MLIADDQISGGTHGSVLARFLELRGRRIIRGCGTLWYTVPGRFLMSLPYQSMLNPDRGELLEMICKAGAFGARFPSRGWTGVDSGLYVLRCREYGIGSLHIKHRPRVRHGQECFEIRPADKVQLLEQGLEINRSTMARQGRYDAEFGEPKKWQRLVDAIFACPDILCPAAIRGNRIAAYMITCREGNWLHILHQMSRQEDLRDFPNHVLTYSVSASRVMDPTVETVCYGYAPLFAADGLHEYKLRFGYELIPHRSAIQLHPKLNAILNSTVSRSLVCLSRRCWRRSQRIEMLQNVLEGVRTSGPCLNSC